MLITQRARSIMPICHMGVTIDSQRNELEMLAKALVLVLLSPNP
jgi:hypothetical protein